MVKSKQNLTESDSYSFGINVGGGSGPSGPTRNIINKVPSDLNSSIINAATGIDLSSAEISLPVSGSLKSDASGDFGAYTDWTFLRPELADQMAQVTYTEMQNFYNHINGKPSINSWRNVEAAVRNFNRAVVINNPKLKGATLYE